MSPGWQRVGALVLQMSIPTSELVARLLVTSQFSYKKRYHSVNLLNSKITMNYSF